MQLKASSPSRREFRLKTRTASFSQTKSLVHLFIFTQCECILNPHSGNRGNGKITENLSSPLNSCMRAFDRTCNKAGDRSKEIINWMGFQWDILSILVINGKRNPMEWPSVLLYSQWQQSWKCLAATRTHLWPIVVVIIAVKYMMPWKAGPVKPGVN